MRRGVAALALLALIFAGAWWLTRRVRHAVNPRPRRPARAPAEATRVPAAARAWPVAPLRLPTATTRPAPAEAPAGFGGRVLSTATRRPVARAALAFFHDGAAVTTESDDAGRFHVVAAGAGAYELTSAEAAGYAPFQAELGHSPVVVWPRPGVRVDDVTIFLTPATELTVRVQAPGGAPIAGAEVRAFDPDRGPAEAAPVRTDGQGEARLEVAPGVAIEARKPGYARAGAYVSVQVVAARRLVVTLTPGREPARAAIAGHVVDAAGQPVDGALVEAWAPEAAEANALPARAQTLTGADGRFTLAELSPGEYTVRASARGQGSAERRPIAAGTRDLELRLGAPSAGIRGRVRDGDGKPIVAFTVVAWRREGVLGRGPETRASVIDPDGRYALPLPPGRYAVAAAARGFARSADEDAEVAEAPVEVDFTLDKGSRVFGRVVERQGGAPIAGATVELEGDAMSDGVTLVSDSTTDADGNFSIDGRRQGRASLDVQAAGHDSRVLGGLEVPAHGALGPLTIDLARVAPGAEPKTEMVGIGAMLGASAAGLEVKSVFPGGGAADAGLRAGDLVLSIDGQAVADLGFGPAIQRIRGPEGSVITFVIQRADGSTALVPITRKRIDF